MLLDLIGYYGKQFRIFCKERSFASPNTIVISDSQLHAYNADCSNNLYLGSKFSHLLKVHKLFIYLWIHMNN